MEEPSTILRDKLPRTLSYPVTPGVISEALGESTNPDHLAFYFLYDSAAQMLLYDPARSPDVRYTVLALRRGLPALPVPTLAGDLEHHDDTHSVLVFPVKARIKSRVLESIREHGLRPLQKWLAAGREAAGKQQRPLVLVYDETGHRVHAKFADDWTGPESGRQYF